MLYIFWFRNIYFVLKSIQWFPIFKKAELQESKNTRKMEPIWLKFGKHLLLWTLITMVPNVFEKNHFRGNFSHFTISRRWMWFLDSRRCLWTQILCTGTIFDPESDGQRVSPKFQTFGKFRNKVWVPPFLELFLAGPFSSMDSWKWHYRYISDTLPVHSVWSRRKRNVGETGFGFILFWLSVLFSDIWDNESVGKSLGSWVFRWQLKGDKHAFIVYKN